MKTSMRGMMEGTIIQFVRVEADNAVREILTEETNNIKDSNFRNLLLTLVVATDNGQHVWHARKKARPFSVQYSAVFSPVLTADQSAILCREQEQDVAPTSLTGHIDPREMGSRVIREMPKDVEKKAADHQEPIYQHIWSS
ncbi:uncharacterized protein EV420DRAFT_331306 [Desarmillaria tabescens]|uniref:Uncharacterized protein n=1 Tax=Armillaria tabescens TaxID=1929756 RepID=A0AA39N620_ARMTA|nr:uncharacterized protein EV420DRAFT_331306 [Desarmillaria tabescens]KAK0458764.1 hypothetical protein EV420DRAFT_331306 [Desarmillaria tabescens]